MLVIDDDEDLCQLTADYLAPLGFHVEAAHTGERGAERATSEPWHAVILDVMLPDVNGFDVLRRIRAKSKVPVLMLTGRGEELDRVVGLELGADDYLPKPFEPRELVARLQTVLRRRRAPQGKNQLEFDGLQIDLDTHGVSRQGETIELTGTEYALLVLLAKAPGKVFSRDDILNHLRGHEADLFTRAVDIVVSRLRKKLEPLDCVKTMRNAGYALAVARSAGPSP